MKNSNYFQNPWMLKFLPLFLLCLFFAMSCENESQETFKEDISDNLYTVAEIKSLFEQKRPLDWDKEKDAKFIYSIATHTNSRIAIGFKPANAQNIRDRMHNINFKSKEWKDVENKIVKIILEKEGKKDEGIIKRPRRLPYIIAKISSLSTIEKLLEMEEVRYVEPMDDSLFAPAN